jgi:hypothetical protein
MSDLLVSAHYALACLWLGGMVTSVVVDRTLASTGEDFRVRLSELHWRVAAYVELPAFLGVLVTGAISLGHPHAWSRGFQVMVTSGLLTLFLGVFKTWLVRKRLAAARGGRWVALEKLSYFQGKLGALVLLGVLTAIVAGVAG